MTPVEALAALKAGNERFLTGVSRHNRHVNRLGELAGTQSPWAVILCCSDSRVAPELLFDTTFGDLFVVRVAGNFADPPGIGSMEYAVGHLGTPLIFILGHSRCGAIAAAVDNVAAGRPAMPGNIGDLVEPLVPSVEAALRAGGDTPARATVENVLMTMVQIEASPAIVAPAIRDEKLCVRGGVYDTDTGRVTFLDA